MSWRVLVLSVLVGLALVTPPAAPALRAHDLQVTHATLTFTPGRFQLDVVVDPESILARLELHGGATPTAGVPAAEIPDRIRALADVALARTRIAFDGVAAPTTFTYLPTAAVSAPSPGVSPGERAG